MIQLTEADWPVISHALIQVWKRVVKRYLPASIHQQKCVVKRYLPVSIHQQKRVVKRYLPVNIHQQKRVVKRYLPVSIHQQNTASHLAQQLLMPQLHGLWLLPRR
jgi:hypothetical protein